MNPIEMRYILPVETKQEGSRRTHWSVARTQRLMAYNATDLSLALAGIRDWDFTLIGEWEIKIELTRVSSRTMDEGNLPGALKHIEDGICFALFPVFDKCGKSLWGRADAHKNLVGISRHQKKRSIPRIKNHQPFAVIPAEYYRSPTTKNWLEVFIAIREGENNNE